MQIHDNRLRSIMDEVLVMAERSHQLMVELSVEAGFYRKRVVDLTMGDVIGVGVSEWLLVAEVTSTCTPEGVGVYEVRFVDDDRVEILDPAEIVDVRAEPTEPGF